jgi:GDP-L-fucose synthase
MDINSKIFVAGHNGLVGSAIVRKLKAGGFNNLILKSHSELDLLNQKAVADFFEAEKPEYVFLAAARVGGIAANNAYPAEFIYSNLTIQNNIINSAYLFGVKKLLFLGSSCIYPKNCAQPIKEEYLLSGPLEETNKAYAVAKIAGIIQCQSYNRQYGTNFISAMPTNLYGPNDNFDLQNSHVLPALLRKFHEAKIKGDEETVVWGTGKAKREFLHVDDLADACVFLMSNYNSGEIINVGTGEDVSIKEAAELIGKTVGFKGKIAWDKSKPDGTPRKLLDVSRLAASGWKYKIKFKDGLKSYYEWFLKNNKKNK